MLYRYMFINCSIDQGQISKSNITNEYKNNMFLEIIENNNKIIENNKKNFLIEYILGDKIKIIDRIDASFEELNKIPKTSLNYILIQGNIISLQEELISNTFCVTVDDNIEIIKKNHGLLYKVLEMISPDVKEIGEFKNYLLQQNSYLRSEVEKLSKELIKHKEQRKKLINKEQQTENIENFSVLKKNSVIGAISSFFNQKKQKEEINKIFTTTPEQIRKEVEIVKKNSIHSINDEDMDKLQKIKHKSSFFSIHSDTQNDIPTSAKKHNKSVFMPSNISETKFLSPQHLHKKQANKSITLDWQKDFQIGGMPLLYGKVENVQVDDKVEKDLIKLQNCFNNNDKLLKSCDNTPRNINNNPKIVKSKLQDMLKTEPISQIIINNTNNDTNSINNQCQTDNLQQNDNNNESKNFTEQYCDIFKDFIPSHANNNIVNNTNNEENVEPTRNSNHSSLWENPNCSHILFEHQQSIKNQNIHEEKNIMFESQDFYAPKKLSPQKINQKTLLDVQQEKDILSKQEEKNKQELLNQEESKSNNSQIVFDTALVRKMTNNGPSNIMIPANNVQSKENSNNFDKSLNTPSQALINNKINSTSTEIKSKPSSFLNNSFNSDWSENPLINSPNNNIIHSAYKPSKFTNNPNINQNDQQIKQQALFNSAQINNTEVEIQQSNNTRKSKKQLMHFRVSKESNDKLLQHLSNNKNFQFKKFKKK